MAVARQTSSTGPIVYAVIATVLFVAAAVLAVMQYTRAEAASQDLDRATEEYAAIVARADTSGADANAIRDARGGEINASTPLLSASVQMTDLLAAAATGQTEGTYRTAIESIQRAQEAAITKVKEAPGGGDLDIQQANAVQTIESLATQLADSLEARKDLEDQIAAKQATITEREASLTAQQATFNAEVEQAQQRAVDAEGKAAQSTDDAEAVINGIIEQLTEVQQTAASDIENMQVEIRALRAEVAEKELVIANLSAQL
ncbi:MAG: hypothetical protein AAF805_13940, partial [Planctomycetota bacterium]